MKRLALGRRRPLRAGRDPDSRPGCPCRARSRRARARVGCRACGSSRGRAGPALRDQAGRRGPRSVRRDAARRARLRRAPGCRRRVARSSRRYPHRCDRARAPRQALRRRRARGPGSYGRRRRRVRPSLPVPRSRPRPPPRCGRAPRRRASGDAPPPGGPRGPRRPRASSSPVPTGSRRDTGQTPASRAACLPSSPRAARRGVGS